MNPIRRELKPIKKTWVGARTPEPIRKLGARLACAIDPADVAYIFNVERNTIYQWRLQYERNTPYKDRRGLHNIGRDPFGMRQ